MDPRVKPVVSGCMPIVTDNCRRLVESLDCEVKPGGPAFFKVEHSMDDIFSQLLKTTMVDNAGHGIRSKVLANKQDMLRLFHQLSRPFLRSILLNTVAYDLYDKAERKANYEQVYDPMSGGGSYIGALHVRGRRGRFANFNEMVKVEQVIKSYARGAYHFDACVSRNGTLKPNAKPSHVDAVKVAHEIDVIGGAKSDIFERPMLFLPRKKESDLTLQDTQKQEEDIENVARMVHGWTAKSQGSKTDFWIQSPLMVGNTKSFKNRTPSHYMEGSMSGSSNSWRLLLYALRFIKVPVEPVIIPMFIAVKPSDIDNSEILGTILAKSRLHDRGLNEKVPGTRGCGDTDLSAAAIAQAQIHVKVDRSWYITNLDRTSWGFPPCGRITSLESLEKVDPELARKLRETDAALEKEKAALETLECQVLVAEKRLIDSIEKCAEVVASDIAYLEEDLGYEVLFELLESAAEDYTPEE